MKAGEHQRHEITGVGFGGPQAENPPFEFVHVFNGVFNFFFIFKYFEINILQKTPDENSLVELPVTFALIYFFLILLNLTMAEISLAFQNKKIARNKLVVWYSLVLLFIVVALMQMEGNLYE